MKQLSVKRSLVTIRLCIAALLLVIISLFLFSFTNKLADDFLKQLGISKANADEKITSSFLGGYLDQYGVQNAKHIATGNRAAVVKDIIGYARKYVSSPAFIKEYNALKESRKPKESKVQTPEEFRKQMIDQYKQSIAQTEATIKSLDASMKKSLEDMLVSARKDLKEMEDGTSKYYINYKKNYPQMQQSSESMNASQLKQWETEFPANHLRFIKGRLEVFMKDTEGIDYSAALVEKGGKKYFVNKEYEYKGDRWKMAYRAGKDAIETARTLVQQWIDEIK